MSKFSDSSHYILKTYFDQLLDPRTGTHNSFLSGQRKTIWADGGLNTTLYQKNDSGDYIAHKFLIQSVSDDNFIFTYVERLSDHSEATELEVDKEMYFRKDSLFHDWLRVHASTYEQSLNTNKTFIYFGKIYTLTNELRRYNIIFDGMKNYVVYAIPEHNRTEKLVELLSIFFDEVYQDIYNMTKTLWSFFDAREVSLDHINYMATRANIETDKDKIETELLLREFVDTLPWWLKRKGSYSSYLDIYKLLLGNTKNKLNFYERWIEWCLKTVRTGYGSIPDSDFEDHHYLEFYGLEPTGGAGPFYYGQYTSASYPQYADTAPNVANCGEISVNCSNLTSFVGWAGQDTGNDMTAVGYNIQIDGFNAATESAYLYSNVTSAANIRNCIEVSMDSSSVPSGGLFVWAASNYPDKTLTAHETNGKNYIGISYEVLGATPSGAVTGRRFKVWEHYNGTMYASSSIETYNADTEYYLTIQKLGTDFKVYVYDNSLRRTQDYIETIQLSLHENASYSVRYAVNSRTEPVGGSWTGDIQNYYQWHRSVDSVAISGYKVLSPHYRLEIDLSSEPMGEDFIISQNQADELLRYWEYLKPVSKFIHYNWLISPLGQIDSLSTSVPLYNQANYTAFLNTQFVGQNFVSAGVPSAAGDFYEETFREIITAADSLWIVRHGLASDELIIQTYTAAGKQNWGIRHYYPDENRVEIEFAGSENGIVLAAGLKPANIAYTQSTPLTAWSVQHNQATAAAASGVVFECVSISGNTAVDLTASTELDTHFNIGTEALGGWTSYIGPSYWSTSAASPSATWVWDGTQYTLNIPVSGVAGQNISVPLVPIGSWKNDFVREKIRLTYTAYGNTPSAGTQWILEGTPAASAIAVSQSPPVSLREIKTTNFGDWWYELGNISKLNWDVYSGDIVYSYAAASAGYYFDALIQNNYFIDADNVVDGDSGTNGTITGIDGHIVTSLYTSGAFSSQTVSGDYLNLTGGFKFDSGLNFETGGGFLTTRAASGHYVQKDDDTRLIFDFGDNGIGDFEIWFDVFWEGALLGPEPRYAYNTNGGLGAPPYTGSEISYFFLTDVLGTVKEHSTYQEGLKWGTHRNAFNNITWHVHDFSQYPTGYNLNGNHNVNYPYGVAKRTGADISIRFWDSPTRDGGAQTLTSITTNQTDKKRYLYVFASWGNDNEEADWVRIGMKNVRLISGDFIPSAASTFWFPDPSYDISKVEVRPIGSGTQNATAIPLFSRTTSGDNHTIPSGGLSEFEWFDITNDTNAPSPWTWQDIEDLNFKVKFTPQSRFDGGFYVDVSDFEVNGKINALTDFPMKVFLNNHSGKNNLDLTGIFNTIGNDYTKFRVVDDLGNTLWTEVEQWDGTAASPSASVWVRVPSFPTTGIKRFRIEYGNEINNNRIGTTGSAKAAKVWDRYFVHVYHMNQVPTTASYPNPLINSQVSSGSNMTAYGPFGPDTGGHAWQNVGSDRTSGAMAIRFDGVNDGYRCKNGLFNTLGMAAFTIESVVSPHSPNGGGTDDWILDYKHSDDANAVLAQRRDYGTQRLETYAWVNGGGFTVTLPIGVDVGKWYYMGGKWSNARPLVVGGNTGEYFNLVSGGTVKTGNFDRGSTIHYIGDYQDDTHRCWPGYIGEVRLSKCERPNSYLKATYETIFDRLINYGTPSGASGETFSLSREDIRITYQQPLGQTGYTGPSSYTLENIEFYDVPVSATKIEFDGLPREAAGYVLLNGRGDPPDYEYDFEVEITSAGAGDLYTPVGGGGGGYDSTYYIFATEVAGTEEWVSYNQALFPFGEQKGNNGNAYEGGIWVDNNGQYVYFGSTGGGNASLEVWEHDGSGGLTLIDTDEYYVGDPILGIWGDGTYIYSTRYSQLTAYSFNGTTLTPIDAETGGAANVYKDVWGDGDYIYTVDDTGGLGVWTFDGATLTEEYNEWNAWNYEAVWAYKDDNGKHIIFAASRQGGSNYGPAGLEVWEWVPGDALYFRDGIAFNSADHMAVHSAAQNGDGNIILYCCTKDPSPVSPGVFGLVSYAYDSTTQTLSTVDWYNNDTYDFTDCWATPDGTRVYFTMGLDGIAYCDVDGSGNITSPPGADYDPDYNFNAIFGYQGYSAGSSPFNPRGGEVAVFGASDNIGNLEYFLDTPSANGYALRAVAVSANMNYMLTNYWGLSGGDAFHANDNNRVWTVGSTSYGSSTTADRLYARFIKYSNWGGNPAVAAEFYSDANRQTLLRRMIINNDKVPSNAPNYVYGLIEPGDTTWPNGKITGYISNMLGLGHDAPELIMPKRAVSMPNRLLLEWSKPQSGRVYIRDDDYYHIQSTAATIWNINHNLNTAGAIIMCYDESRQLIFPDEIELVDADNTRVTFNEAVAGHAVFVVFQRDYETASFLSPFGNPDIIGFWKVGTGGDEVGFEPVDKNDLNTPVVSGSLLSFTETASGNAGYVLINFKVPENGAYTLNEFGVFDENKNLHYYSKLSDLHKPDGVSLDVLYRISKTPLVN